LGWNTWGPITESAEEVLDWVDSDIGMKANYGNIAFMVTVLPAMYYMDVKGTSPSCLPCTTWTSKLKHVKIRTTGTCIRILNFEN